VSDASFAPTIGSKPPEDDNSFSQEQQQEEEQKEEQKWSAEQRAGMGERHRMSRMSREGLFGASSRIRTMHTTHMTGTETLKHKEGKENEQEEEEEEENEEEGEEGKEEENEEGIKRLISTIFGPGRQHQSEEEKTRHVGVVFKHLTVKAVGLGVAIQPTIGDIFLALPRKLGALLNRKKKEGGGPPIRTIINDFSGVIRPGEMLLVLGRPGSGCSTFLKVLGNQRAGYKAVKGEVNYGGESAEKMANEFRNEVLYNPEDDFHYATLSVRRTLEFALRTRTPGKESRLEGESRKSYVNAFLRMVTRLFWIEHTLDTFVGSESVRGISGGERKRVSIAEGLITKASTQMWDNSTRGLDASTALEYVNSIRILTNMAKISTAVALYQAGESLYKAFDKVILIDEGRCCYFGSADDAVEYFENLGFERPPRWTTADFLTSVTDEHERRVKEGWEDAIPKTAEEFERAFRSSEAEKRNWRDIEDFENTLEEQRRVRAEETTKKSRRKNYTLPFYLQVAACTTRQFFVILGDRQTQIGKWGIIFFQSLITGSLFYNMPKTSAGVFLRGGVLFFMLLFNTLLALAELTNAFGSRAVLLKHKAYSFCRPSAFAISQVVIDLPLIAVQVTIFDLVVYFLSNLQRTPSQFFISLLILWVSTLCMYAYFRAIGAWSRSLDVATRVTGVSIQAFFAYTGYIIPPKKMRPWLAWLRWINPLQYAFEALMANEFDGLEIQCVPPMLVPFGPHAQPGYQACALIGSEPNRNSVSGANFVMMGFNYTRAHLWRNVGIIIGFWLFFVALTALGMEHQKPNAGGGAVRLFKRGEVPKSVDEGIGRGDVPKNKESDSSNCSSGMAGEKSKSSAGDDGNDIPKIETVFTFQNVHYTIPYKKGERKLLQGVNGYIRPGRLIALMGASGAGKTTLLNILAQRHSIGVVTGEFLVDGGPLPKSFQRSTGFAEQMDIHEPTATVREAFRFSALLRQPKEVSRKLKYAYVERIIDLLELRDLADATIGKIGSGLNQEQRKRATIGVELASKPELLLFLDEPTSGLDSRAAFNTVRLLRKLTDAGQAIICTVHQPSAILFHEFDELLLLQSGGRVVFHGTLENDSKNLIEYFESHGAKKCPKDMNPAEYMLEVIGAGDPSYKGDDWADIWERSPNAKARQDDIQQLIAERREAIMKDGHVQKDDREYAMPYSTQICAVVKRCFTAYWRTPEYFIGKLALHIFSGLFNTFTFWKLGLSTIDMQSHIFTIFITLNIAPPLMQQLQPRYLAFRSVYRVRESGSKIYAWPAFVLGAALPEIPYSFFCGTVFFCCWYFGVGLPLGFPAGYVYLCICLFEVFYVGMGQFIAAMAPTELLASLMVSVFYLFVIAFSGVVVPYPALPHFWQSWMYWLTPFHYLLEGMLGVVTHDVPVVCQENEFAVFSAPPGQTCDSYTDAFVKERGGYVTTRADGMCGLCQYANGDQYAAGFNVFYRNRWRDYGLMWLYDGFNFFVVFLVSWLYLGGARKIWRVVSPKQRKVVKEQRRAREKASDG